jgi:tetratricopeptide (TPR) repeat protein
MRDPSRRTPLRAALLVGCAGLISACKPSPGHDGAASGPAPEPSAKASAAASDGSPLATAKRLALARSSGGQPADREIEGRQKALAGEKASESTDAWVLLGRAWVKKARESSDPGFYLNARACADVALEIAPQNRAAQNLVAIVLLNQHKFDEARDLAEQILVKASHDMMALGTLSDAHLEVGRYGEAQRAAQRMMDLKPNLPSYVRVSYLEWLRGDRQAAIESARAAIDAGKDPNDPEPRCWALTQAALMFWHGGDLKGADTGFEAALKECHDYPPALAGRGRVAMANGDGAHAAQLLAKSFAESPLAETAWLLGDAREMAGDAKAAEESYAQVAKIGRASDGRTLALFWATKDREHDEAVKLAEAEKKIRDDIYTEDALAWALYRAGKIAGARAAIEKATALGTKEPRLLFHAGAIKLAAGEKEQGLKLINEALALNARFDLTGAAEAAKLAGASAR